MKLDFICRADSSVRNYNAAGYAQEELLPGADIINANFYRCSLKSGEKISPELEDERLVILIFNGAKSYITTPDELYNIDEPSFFIPEFDRMFYTVHALQDIEFIKCVFTLNEWDKDFYKFWRLKLPFFSKYSDGVQYDQDCKGPNTRSWSILQPFQLGHISIGVVHSIGEGTDEKGHDFLHQWNYCLPGSDFELTVDGETVSQKSGDWSFIYAGKDHKLIAKPGNTVFYVWVECFTEEDLQKYYLHQIYNGSLSEVK